MGEAVRKGPDETEAIFLAAVEGARPLADRERARAAPPAPVAVGTKPPADSRRFLLAEDLASGRAHGVNRATVSALAAGRTDPESTVDLHGHTLDSARERLGRFLAESRAAQRRCVLVVTGKSARAAGADTIHDQVPRWLAGPLSTAVLAFARARPAHGGDGALYVLLRTP